MPGRTNYNGNRSNNPGPGQYNSDNVSQTLLKPPTWRIGSASRGDDMKRVQRENFPGPGNYGSINGEKGQLGGPKYSFGREQRSSSAKQSTPGPGHYRIPYETVNHPNYAGGNFDEAFKFI